MVAPYKFDDQDRANEFFKLKENTDFVLFADDAEATPMWYMDTIENVLARLKAGDQLDVEQYGRYVKPKQADEARDLAYENRVANRITAPSRTDFGGDGSMFLGVDLGIKTPCHYTGEEPTVLFGIGPVSYADVWKSKDASTVASTLTLEKIKQTYIDAMRRWADEMYLGSKKTSVPD